MNHQLIRRCLCAGALLATLASQRAYGQAAVNFNVAGPANWNDPNSWSTLQVPAAQFSEFAVITGGRSAFVDGAEADIGAITMGAGNLEIRPGGSLAATAGGLNTGILNLGAAGGNVSVRRGCTLSAESIISAGGAGTQLVLGETTGSGTASLTAGSASLGGTTRITGSTVNFDVTGSLSFAPTNRLIAEITGLSHSAIDVGGSATLGGTVVVEFNGHTPALGNSWTLVNAASIAGNFAVDASAAPNPARGTGYQIVKTDTSASLKLSNQLILTINRLNGATKIENVIGSPIDLDGYTISSPAGNLGGNWNSLQEQAFLNWDEASTSNATRLTEFRTSGATLVAVGSPLSLGTPFQTSPSALGINIQQDISFSYTTQSGQIVDGAVELSGPENNLVLTIDPATGQTTIQNESIYFNARIDAYTITSADGRLKVADGDWSSLDDQNLGDWDQADNSDANRVTEFKPTGSTLFGGAGTIFAMGDLVNIAGGPLDADDFTFTYALSDGTELAGIVKIGALPTPGLNGDVNFDGVVDIFDVNVISDNWGEEGPQGDANHDGVVDIFDVNVVSDNWGATAGVATAQAVPEPGTMTLCILALGAVAAVRRYRNV